MVSLVGEIENLPLRFSYLQLHNYRRVSLLPPFPPPFSPDRSFLQVRAKMAHHARAGWFNVARDQNWH